MSVATAQPPTALFFHAERISTLEARVDNRTNLTPAMPPQKH